MIMIKKELYAVPETEVLELKLDSGILQTSAEGYTYDPDGDTFTS